MDTCRKKNDVVFFLNAEDFENYTALRLPFLIQIMTKRRANKESKRLCGEYFFHGKLFARILSMKHIGQLKKMGLGITNNVGNG